MSGTLVTEDQFELNGHQVVHVPTGATFTAYANIAEWHNVNWGEAGNVLPNGDDYDREDIARVATHILANRKLETL